LMQAMSITPPPPHRDIKTTAGLVTMGTNSILTFGSITDNTELEKRYIKWLTSAGLTVKLHRTKENKDHVNM
jgi:hypothetical protein